MDKRGGKRSGAGRKELLSGFARIAVGGRVEKRLVEALNQQFQADVRATYAGTGLEEKWAMLNQLVLNPKTGKRSLKGAARELQLDIQDNIKSRTGTARIFLNPSQRLAGRAAILREVAAQLSSELGRTVTPRYVEKCLEAHRAFEKRRALEGDYKPKAV